MISTASIIGMIFSIALSLVLPLVLMVVLSVKKILSARAVLAGAASYMLFQVVIRQPLVAAIVAPDKLSEPVKFLFYILLMAVTAGIAETAGRYVFGRFFLKDDYCFKTAVGLGLGAGGIESMLIVGLGSVANLASAIIVNKGGGSLVESMGEANYNAAVEALKSINPIEYYCVGFERVMAMLMHILLAALVILAIKRAKPLMLLIPLAAHTLFDFSLNYISQTVNSLAAEGAALVFGAVAVYFTLKLRKPLDAGYEPKPSRTAPPPKKVDISDYLS